MGPITTCSSIKGQPQIYYSDERPQQQQPRDWQPQISRGRQCAEDGRRPLKPAFNSFRSTIVRNLLHEKKSLPGLYVLWGGSFPRPWPYRGEVLTLFGLHELREVVVVLLDKVAFLYAMGLLLTVGWCCHVAGSFLMTQLWRQRFIPRQRQGLFMSWHSGRSAFVRQSIRQLPTNHRRLAFLHSLYPV